MKLRQNLGYAAFFIFSFVVGLYLTFPWILVKDRILALVKEKTGVKIAASKLEPHWVTGVELENVEIQGSDPKAEPTKLDKIRARVSLLKLLAGKPGGSVWIPMGKGTIDASFAVGKDVFELDADIEKLALEETPFLLAASGLPLVGTLDLEASLKLGKDDPKQSRGKIVITTKGFEIEKGGKLGPLPVPALVFGDLKLELPLEDGKIDLKGVKLPGADLEIALDGSISPAWPLAKGTINLTVGLKPTEKLLSADPLLRPLLNNFQSYKDGEGFYGIALVGSLAAPRPQPKRRGG